MGTLERKYGLLMALAAIESSRPGKSGEEPESDAGKMSFLEHLNELRQRLVRIIAYTGAGFLACLYFHRQIYHFISAPILPFLPNKQLIVTGVMDSIVFDMKVSLIAGIFLTSPFTLFEIWKFIAPALYQREKRFVLPFLMASVLLFVGGGMFCYYFVLPMVFDVMLKWNPEVTPFVAIDKYLDFTNMMLLSFAAVFEMPVVVAFLSIFGLVTAKFLLKNFHYALLIIVIAAAVISPTQDGISLLMWAAPMLVLYIVSIGVAALFGWRRRIKRVT